MTNKNIIIASLVALVVGASLYFLSQTSSYNQQAQGHIVFGITDAAENMGSVSSVFVTVNKVEMHSEIDGWITVSNETKQYDLLALKQSGKVSLLASSTVPVGTYNQVRLMVSKVVVVRNGVSEEAKLPSGELKLIGNIKVNADQTSSMVFDFIADKSLHLTGNGKFIFAPVVKTQTRSDIRVKLKLDDEVEIAGGKEENDEDAGMDEKGEMRKNFELKDKLDIDGDDRIQLKADVDVKVGIKDEGEDGENSALAFNFSAQNNSNVSGTVTLTKESEEKGNVKVTLRLKSSLLGILKPEEPAHIHFGSCANLGGVKYSLNSVVNGKSETTLNVSFADLKAGLPLAVNVHKSVAEPNVYIACANLNF